MKTETVVLLCVSALFLAVPTTSMADDVPFVLTKYTQFDSRLGFDVQPNGQPLQVAGKTYKKGLSTGTVVMELELKQKCRSFSVDVGMTHGASKKGLFVVLLDETIFHKGSQGPKQVATNLVFPCQSVSKITLVSRFADGNLWATDRTAYYRGQPTRGDNNRTIWANARVQTAEGETVYLSDVLKRQDKLPWTMFKRELGRVDIEPETKTLSQAQGEKLIERDWLMQAEGYAIGQRSLDEIHWARQMADRIIPDVKISVKERIDVELARLLAIEKRLVKKFGPRNSEQVDLQIKNRASLTEILGTSIVGNSNDQNADISIPIDNGIYKIQLLIYEGWGAYGRQADFSLEGKRIAHNYKYWERQEKTHNNGSLISCSVEIEDGQIDVSVKGTVGDVGPHISGIIISKTDSISSPGFALVDGPGKLDLANVVKAINFGVTKNQTISGTTFLSAAAKSTVAGVTNNAGGQVTIKQYNQTVPTFAVKIDLLADRDDYTAVRRCKRAIMLLHPAIDFSQIVMLDTPYPSGFEWFHESRFQAGFMGTPGSRLLVLDGLSPCGAVRKLAPQGKSAAIRRADLSFDGKRVLFPMNIAAKKSSDKNYNLYEINLDGTGLRQLTSSKYDDIDPIYLPDGNIALLTSRSNVYAGCGPWAPQHTMARCDKDGKNIYLLSVASESEYWPSVMDNGTMLYTRWEYNDKGLNPIQSLWTMNTDGTMSSTYWGNQSFYPDHIGEGRQIPGTSLVVFNGMGHHDVYTGSIGVVDNRQGLDNPYGLYKVTQDVQWAESGDGPVKPKPYCKDYHSSGKLKYGQYKSPYPLSKDMFLVSVRTTLDNSESLVRDCLLPSDFKLYLMDKWGNHELIYSGAYNILHALPVRKRQKPISKPSAVKWPDLAKGPDGVSPGILYSANVYEGMPKEMQGKAKYLRVLEAVQRVYTTGVIDGGGPSFGSDHNEALERYPVNGNPEKKEVDVAWGDGSMFTGPATAISTNTRLKRVLGTVPIAKDGSYSFYAPPGKAIYFQLLDENKLVLQSMRSWVNVMPGEVRGCVGCHESRINAPVGQSIGSAGQPDKLTPPSWGVKTLSYLDDIQPIFDKNCAKCHQGQGKARKKLDLTLRPDPRKRWGGIFPEPYITLTCGKNEVPNGANMTKKAMPTIAGNFFIKSAENDITTFAPMTKWSYKSPLINMHLHGKHHNVRLSREDMDKLKAWVDTNCHYRGLKDVMAISDPEPNWFVHWPYPPLLKSAPYVNHLYKQDQYNSPADRPTLRSQDEELKNSNCDASVVAKVEK